MRQQDARKIGSELLRHVKDDDVPGIAAQLAFRFLFAVFPFGLFVAALGAFVAGWLGIQNPAQQIVDALGDNLPPDIASTIKPELETVIGNARPGLLSIGAITALWAATGGTNALIKAMNKAYDVEETRAIPLRYALAAGLTILASAGILFSFVTIVGGALLTQQLAEELGIPPQAYTLVSLLRWPIVAVMLIAAVSVLFRVAPNVRVAWKWVIAGAAVFTIGWLLATVGFAFYIGNFGNYGATYGSLGGVIVLMLWFYLTGILLVGAAELVASTVSVLDPEALRRERNRTQAESRAAQAKDMARKAGRKAHGWADRLLAAIGVRQAEQDDGTASAGADSLRADGTHRDREEPRDRQQLEPGAGRPRSS